jgi:TPR repeat protein
MYANGEGVEIDIAKTRELWMKAAAQGHKLAINFLRQIDRN